MENKKTSFRILDLIQIIICAVFLAGSLSFFAPCGPKADGGWMACHWAGRAVSGTAAVLLVIALIRIFIKDTKIKLGLSVASLPVVLLAALIPGKLINLCMMESMLCHSVMRPMVTVFSVLIFAASLVDIIISGKKQ